MRERERERESSLLVYVIIGAAALYSFLFYAAFPILSDSWRYSVNFTTHFPYTLKGGMHPGRNISEFLDIIFGQGLGAPLGVLLDNPILGIRLANALGCAAYLTAFWLISLQFFSKKYKKIAAVFIILLSFFLPTISFGSHYLTLQVLGGYTIALYLAFIFTQHYIDQNNTFKNYTYSKYGYWFALCYLASQITDSGYFTVSIYIFLSLLIPFITSKINDAPSPKQNKKLWWLAGSYFLLCGFALIRNFNSYQWGYRKSSISLDIYTLYSRLTANHVMIDVSIILAAIVASWIIVKLLRKELEPQEQLSLAMLASGLAVILICCILGTYFDQAIWIIWIGLLRFAFSRWKEGCKITSLIMPTIGLWLFVGAFVVTQPKFSIIRARYDYRNAEFFQAAEEKGLEILYLTDDDLKYLNIGNYNGSLYPNASNALVQIGILSKPIKIEPISKKPLDP